MHLSIMKRKSPLLAFLVAVLLAALLVPAAPVRAADEYDTLRQRWKEYLTGGTAFNPADPDIAATIAALTNNANTFWSSLNTANPRSYLWSDLPGDNITDTLGAYNRLKTMALALSTTGSSLYGNTTLKNDIVSAMDWQYANRYNSSKTNDYWYRFEISTPRTINDLTVLMYDHLTATQINNYMGAIDHFSPDPNYQVNGTRTSVGANRMEKCLVVGLRGVIGKNAPKIAMARDAVGPALDVITSGNGFYRDGSYLFHGGYAQSGSYGIEQMKASAGILYLLNDSTWEITDPDLNNIFLWAYRTFQPTIYRGLLMDMTRARSISRSSTPDSTGGKVFAQTLLEMIDFAPSTDAVAYKSMLKEWIGNGALGSFYTGASIRQITKAKAIMNDSKISPRGPLVLHKQYPTMDRISHQRPDFAFGLSLFSDRISSYETESGENKKGWYTGHGMTYLYNNDLTQFGDSFWPTVNPKRLPGITVDAGLARADLDGGSYRNTYNWVGGTELGGLYGTGGMQYDAFNATLKAQKSWFMFDDEVVALGAGVSSTDNRTIETIVENRKLNGSGSNALTVNGTAKSTALGWSETMSGVNWAHLAGNTAGSDIGYYFPGGATIKGLREARTGAWSDINPNGSTTPITRNYMNLLFDHGANPVDKTYAYVLLPNKSTAQVGSYANSPDITVLANTRQVQAVKENSLNIVAANFWSNIVQTVDILTSDKKSSVMVREVGNELDVSLSDPTQSNTGTINIEINKAATSVISRDSAITVTQMSPTIKLTANVAGLEGRTTKVKFGTAAASTALPLSASHDAMIRGGASAATNYGSDATFAVKDTTNADLERKAYLRFDLSDFTRIDKAKLRLYGSSSANTTVIARGGTNDAWTEGALTWNNAVLPASSILATTSIGTTAGWIELDMTTFVQGQLAGDKTATIVVSGTGLEDTMATFNSGENSVNKPQLAVSGTIDLYPAADAFVRSGAYSAINYGANDTLLAKDTTGADVQRRSYLKFDLSALSGLPSLPSAVLRLYGSGSSSMSVKANGAANDTWTETGITWNNAPAPNAAALSTVTVNALKTYNFPVTSFIQSERSGDRTATLVIDGVGDQDELATFNSREQTWSKPSIQVKYD